MVATAAASIRLFAGSAATAVSVFVRTVCMKMHGL